jgi:23S rRNA (pseudouridine1915-N3)-methyltransferase
LRYRLLTVGRRADDVLLVAARDYINRLGRYVATDVLRIREGSLLAERDALLRALEQDDLVVGLDERGAEHTTSELASLIARWQREGARKVAFVIGGSEGLHADVKRRARQLWSLSRFTLPHRLALVVLAEQLYRVHTMLRGEPYHRS